MLDLGRFLLLLLLGGVFCLVVLGVFFDLEEDFSSTDTIESCISSLGCSFELDGLYMFEPKMHVGE